jgi:hypothetical protein
LVSGDNQDQAGDLLIQEVDEDLRREQYLRLWRLYGKYGIAALVAIVLGVAGHQVWLNLRDRQFQQQAARFAAAQTLAVSGDKTQSLAKLAEIAGNDGSGFAVAAAFERVELQIDAGDAAGASAGLEALSQSTAPQIFRDLAVLKLVMLSLDKGDPEILSKRLQPLADKTNPWRFTATELLALLSERHGDRAAASLHYKQLADDADAPQNIRSRAAQMLALWGQKPGAAKPEKG